MVFKWVFVVFAVAALALYALGKILAFLNPPVAGHSTRPGPSLARRAERALRWTLLVPLAIVILLLVLALSGKP